MTSKFIITRTPDPCSFSYRIHIHEENGDPVITNINPELFQDIQFGDWAGMFGPPDKPRSADETWNIVREMYINDAPEDRKQIVGEAMDFVRNK